MLERVSVQQRQSKQTDIYAAAAAAEGFLCVAESLVHRISRLPEGRLPPSSVLPPEYGEMVVAATNLAFALELYLKTILVVLRR